MSKVVITSVFVVPALGPNAIGLVRSTKQARPKMPVYVGAPFDRPALASSRHVEKSFIVARPYSEKYIDDLREIGRKLTAGGGKSLLCLTHDEYIIACAEHWHRLEEFFVALFPSAISDVYRCMDKVESWKLAESCGVPTPFTRDSVESFLADGGTFPAIVKPALKGAENARANAVFRIRKCADRAALDRACDIVKAAGERFVVQSFIEGADDQLYTAGISALDGVCHGVYTGRKLRQFPPSTGVAALAETVAVHRVAKYGVTLLEAAGFTGMAQVEFKKSEVDGEYYLMEINPRPWMWNGLSADSGVNLMEAFFRASEGEAPPRAPLEWLGVQRDVSKWTFAWPDLWHNVIKNRNASPLQYLGDVFCSSSHAVWDERDPGLMVGHLRRNLTRAVGKVGRMLLRKK